MKKYIFILDFKKDIYEYYLKYTRDLINTVVKIRNKDVDLIDLTALVERHASSEYNDADVSNKIILIICKVLNFRLINILMKEGDKYQLSIFFIKKHCTNILHKLGKLTFTCDNALCH